MAGYGAAVNVAKPKKGQTVAVFGLGAVGLAVSFSNLIWCVASVSNFQRTIFVTILIVLNVFRLQRVLEFLAHQG